jgi:hypothetical protein
MFLFKKQSLPKKADDNKRITKEKEIAKVVRNQQINKINLLNELRERNENVQYTKGVVAPLLTKMYQMNITTEYIESPDKDDSYRCNGEFLDIKLLEKYRLQFEDVGYKLYWHKKERMWMYYGSGSGRYFPRYTLQYWFYLHKIDNEKKDFVLN